MLVIDDWGIPREIALGWMSLNLTCLLHCMTCDPESTQLTNNRWAFISSLEMNWIDCFKVPSGALGSAAWAARVWAASSCQVHVVETVYELEFTELRYIILHAKVWTLAKMPWPGIKFNDFSQVFGKSIKFLDFSRAGKHFFVFPGLFPNSQTGGNSEPILRMILAVTPWIIHKWDGSFIPIQTLIVAKLFQQKEIWLSLREAEYVYEWSTWTAPPRYHWAPETSVCQCLLFVS